MQSNFYYDKKTLLSKQRLFITSFPFYFNLKATKDQVILNQRLQSNNDTTSWIRKATRNKLALKLNLARVGDR